MALPLPFDHGPAPLMKDGSALCGMMAELDRLIDWYQKHKPDYRGPLTMPARFQRFDVRTMLERTAVRKIDGHYYYRGFALAVRTELKMRWKHE